MDGAVFLALYSRAEFLSEALGIEKATNDTTPVTETTGNIHNIVVAHHQDSPTIERPFGSEIGSVPWQDIVYAAIKYAFRYHDQPPQFWMKPLSLICRGYRRERSLPNDLKKTHENSQTALLLSRHFEDTFLKAGETLTIRKQHLYNLLTDQNVALFLPIHNGCYIQLTGLAMDELYTRSKRAMLPTPMPTDAATATATTPLEPTSAAADHAVIHGKWELPRSSIRIPGTSKADNSPAHFLRYCVNIYHSTTFSSHPGFPLLHVMNAFREPAPALFDFEEDAVGKLTTIDHMNDLHRIARRWRDMNVVLRHAASTMSQHSSKAGASSSVISSQKTASMLSVSAMRSRPVPVCAADITDNNARRLMHHIFVHKPHIHDIRCYTDRQPAPSSGVLCCHVEQNAAAKCTCGKFCRETTIPASLVGSVGLFRDLLANHYSTPYARYLALFCPVVTWASSSTISSSKSPTTLHKRKRDGARITQQSLGDPLKLACPPENVFRFVRAILRRVIPRPLWGDNETRRCLLSSIYRWIMMNRNDTLRVSDVVEGIRTSSIPLGNGPVRATYVHTWILWIILSLVSVLLKTHFHITYSESTQHRTLYFRKPTWAHLTKHGIDTLFQKLQLQKISKVTLTAELLSGNSSNSTNSTNQRLGLGFGSMRLAVKATGVRPIMNLASSKQVPGTDPAVNLKGINSVLSVLYDCLKAEAAKRGPATGAAVFSVQGVHEAVVKYTQRVDHSALPADARLHAIACDVSGAFDTIRQQLAIDLASKLLPESALNYVLSRYAVLRLWSSKNSRDPAMLRCKWHRAAFAETEPRSFLSEALKMSAMYRNAVFVDSVENTRHGRKQLLKLLAMHLTAHIVQLPNGLFVKQRTGIPQGSILSTLVCNLYLGHFERHVILPKLGECLLQMPDTHTSSAFNTSNPVPSLLLRFTDDILLLSYHESVVQSFAKLLTSSPFASHNVTINTRKTKASFRLHALPAVEPVRRIAWCGLLFDTDFGGIFADVSRYCGGASSSSAYNAACNTTYNVADSIAFAGLARPKEALARMMRAFLKPKCQPILLDARINSLGSVALNVFQIVLLAGAKLCCVLSEMARRMKSRSSREVRHEVIDAVIDYGRCSVELCMTHLLALIHNRCRGGVGTGVGTDVKAASLQPPQTTLSASEASPVSASSQSFLSFSFHLSSVDAVRLTLHNGSVLTTSHSLKAPEETPLLHTTVCPLYDDEIKYLCLKALETCFNHGKPFLRSLVPFCSAKYNSGSQQQHFKIRQPVIQATDLDLSPFFFLLGF